MSAQAYAQVKTSERAISPASLDAVLAVLGYGASGPAQQQLFQLYGFTDRSQFLQLLQRITQVMSDQDIKGGNAIFFEKRYSTINPEFYRAVANYMYLSQSDFTNANQARQEVNGWIERNSGLPDVIPLLVFQNPDLKMIVANALWFKDEWERKFLKHSTRPDNFTNRNGQVVQVPTMSQTCTMSWLESGPVTAVKLMFKNGAYAEFFLGLPENQVIPDHGVIYQQGKVELYLPKFEAKQEINLLPVFQAIGLSGLFNDGFGNIRPERDLGVSAAAQKLVARFDEDGAEVKVATYAGIALACIAMPPPEQPKIIRFDRPFHYRIVKNGISLIDGWYNGEEIFRDQPQQQGLPGINLPNF